MFIPYEGTIYQKLISKICYNGQKMFINDLLNNIFRKQCSNFHKRDYYFHMLPLLELSMFNQGLRSKTSTLFFKIIDITLFLKVVLISLKSIREICKLFKNSLYRKPRPFVGLILTSIIERVNV